MPKESSAVMRFIDLVQNQPIIEKPLEEPLNFAEPSSSFALPPIPGSTAARRKSAKGTRPPVIPEMDAELVDDTKPEPKFPARVLETQVVATLPSERRVGLSRLWYALGAFCFVGLGVGIGLLANSGGSPDAAGAAASKSTESAKTTAAAGINAPSSTDSTQKPAAKPPTPTVAAAPVPVVGDQDEKQTDTADAPEMTAQQLKSTGFDIRVSQKGTTVSQEAATVTLDGKEIGKAPLRVRNLKAGAHTIAISAPKGFMSVSKEFELGVAEAKEVTIELEKVAVKLPETIVANFTSEPPGAKVTLFVKGEKLISKVTPIKMKLRTGHEYTAEFSRDGYTSVKKPVEIVDGGELKVAAVLQTNRVAVAPKRVATRRNLRRPTRRARTARRTATRTKRAKRTTRRARKTRTARKSTTKKGYGTLLIGSKPPCKIYVNGRPTGLTTPQRGIKLKAGKHRISLINRKYKIRRTVTVRIASGKRTRVIRDFSHKVK